jgi:hypothetical protein
MRFIWQGEGFDRTAYQQLVDSGLGYIYGFETEMWKIPNQSCHGMRNRKILNFVMTEDDPADHLFIVYYEGHAKLTKDRLLSWTRLVHQLFPYHCHKAIHPLTHSNLHNATVGDIIKTPNAQRCSGVAFRMRWSRPKVTYSYYWIAVTLEPPMQLMEMG